MAMVPLSPIKLPQRSSRVRTLFSARASHTTMEPSSPIELSKRSSVVSVA